MSIYLSLFLTFLEIGAVSFGGGYAMIPLIRDKCLSNNWLTEDSIMNFIAVSESTPGPIAINMATFVGSSQAGFWGALCATLGVVLPSFVIILLIATLIRNILKYAGVKATLGGIRPVVTGLIVATSFTMFLSVILGIKTVTGGVKFDYKALIIFAIVTIIATVWKFFRKKNISPILLIIISAGLGMLCYAL